jgi:hypothetical protein
VSDSNLVARGRKYSGLLLLLQEIERRIDIAGEEDDLVSVDRIAVRDLLHGVLRTEKLHSAHLLVGRSLSIVFLLVKDNGDSRGSKLILRAYVVHVEVVARYGSYLVMRGGVVDEVLPLRNEQIAHILAVAAPLFRTQHA